MTESAPAVLIVGAGPTGLSLAYFLHRHGISARIVDAGPGPSAESRALGIQPRTLENFGRDICDKLIAQGQRIVGAEVFSWGERLVHTTRGHPLPLQTTEHPTLSRYPPLVEATYGWGAAPRQGNGRPGSHAEASGDWRCVSRAPRRRL